MFLARSVDPGWWRTTSEELGADEIPADLVTDRKQAARQLVTSGNALSFWSAADALPDGELRQVVLAIATTFHKPDRVVLTWIDRESAIEDGLELRPTPGDTLVRDLVDRHVDIARLDLRRLALVAAKIAVAVRNEGRLQSFTQSDVLDILADAVEQKRLRLDGLKRELKEAVRARVAQRTGAPGGH